MPGLVSLIVRHVAAGDSDAWLRLRGALWPEGRGADHANEIARFLDGRAREPVAVLIAEDETGKALGFAELSIRAYAEGCDSDQVPFLEGWYVIPEARQKGVGRALVAAAEEWARSRGFSEFASDADLANDISAAAHEALGFTEVARVRCFRKDL